VDGDFDYSQLSRAQLQEALTRIERTKYPINYERILRELETRPPDQPALPAPSSPVSLVAWYSVALFGGCVSLWLFLGIVLRLVGAAALVTGSRFFVPLVGVTVPFVLYLRLVAKHPQHFRRVALAIAFVGSLLCTLAADVLSGYGLSRPAMVFFGMLSANVVIASLVSTRQGMRQLQPPSNNRWRGP
jgi:hypothetical protein